MEPANLTPPPDDFDARFDALLRVPTPALPDDDFSARVITALPPPRRAPARWTRTTLCGVASLLGSVAAVIAITAESDGQAIWGPLSAPITAVKGSFNDPNVWVTLIVALGSVAYALLWLPRKMRE